MNTNYYIEKDCSSSIGRGKNKVSVGVKPVVSIENSLSNANAVVDIILSEIDTMSDNFTKIGNSSFYVNYESYNRPYSFGGSCYNDPHCSSIDGSYATFFNY